MSASLQNFIRGLLLKDIEGQKEKSDQRFMFPLRNTETCL